MRILCRALLLACGIWGLWSEGADFVATLLSEAPRIDGSATEAGWQGAVGFDGFQYQGTYQRRRARALIGATRDTLYVAILTQLPDEGALRQELKRDSLKVVHDASVEVYVNPTPASTDCVEYQFLVNSGGFGGYNIHVLGQATEDPSWRGNWQQAHGFHEGWWHAEFAIPIHSMKGVAEERRTTDGEWRINVTRNWKMPWEWSSLSGGYPHSGPTFAFVEKAVPAVQATFSEDPSFPPFVSSLAVTNPGMAPLPATVAISLSRNSMPALQQDWSGSLAAGETKLLALDVPKEDPTTRYELSLTVSSGESTVYQRTLSWKRADRPLVWKAGIVEPPPPLDLRFAHYPYRREMRVIVDTRGLDNAAQLQEATVVIRPELGGDALETVVIPAGDFEDGIAECVMAADLAHGDYILAASVHGSGVPEGEVTKRFERHVFPWERLPVGRGTEVYAPFEPIAVDGASVRTVLRDHTLSGSGLFEQVVCESANTGVKRPLLAAPMRLMVERDGNTLAMAPGPLRTEATAAHEATLHGGCQAADVQVETRTHIEYDGAARIDLTLQAATPVEALSLEIPLRPEVATMIHANADRIRAPVAAYLSAEKGVIWDAGQVACDDFIPNFCPYVYLGDAVRGLCWFAENDLNWGWDPATPNLVVERTDDAVILRVHLINQPTDLSKPRTLTFGILAAPVKPRLRPPETSPHWWRYRYMRDNYTLLGTDINWLSMGTCGSVYPAGKNLWLWEMLARGNRRKLPAEAVEQVIATGLKYFKSYGEKEEENFKRHVRHNLRSRYGSKMVFYYNRASHQAAEEFETFKDEWCLTDLRSVGKGRGIGEIKIVPSESYIDYNLYWYARSFEIGRNQGVYWDNWFIAPSFNTTMTAAYRRDDGSIAPAAGLWAMRDLAKRTFVMMNERGMLPITFPHMTSFNPLPLMSFATVQYDWEWKYSKGDIQDRHSREYILLASTGDLAGVWPVPLTDHGNQGSDPWTQRTFTAVRLLHELDGYGGFGQSWNKAHQANAPLFDPIAELLDDPNLTVFRYWEQSDRPQPVHSATPDVHTVVYSVPQKRAVVVVTSYSRNRENVQLTVDAEALGFGQGTVRFINTENGNAFKVEGDGIRFDLPAHDVRVFSVQGTP